MGVIARSMIDVEFYGVPRLRAGTAAMRLEAATIGDALREVGRRCPAFEPLVLDRGTVHPAYKVSVNGDRFVSDPETPLSDGDVLLLLSADAGG
jgi:molybdopterin converting factor small subunit